MPVYSPLTDRALGILVARPDSIRFDNPGPVITRPDGLTPCWRNRVHCPKCGQFERLVAMDTAEVSALCDLCGKNLIASDVCRGWTSQELPFISRSIRIKNGMEVRTSWSRMDGSRPRVKVRRRGDSVKCSNPNTKGALPTSEIAGADLLSAPTSQTAERNPA
jgi:ribosomal protein S27E